MDDTGWIIVLAVAGVVLLAGICHGYRRWKTGKLADKLLADVIKGKDAFRRR
ncbi:MAG: hypothetical protein U0236_13100 [Nitrospira sp.]